MPIVRIPEPDSPLRQGDILSGINLFATMDSHHPDGGSEAKLRADLCLVLSRPCVALRDRVVIVAAVEKFSRSPPRELKLFDEILAFLKKYRDGHGLPDVSHLGQLPGRADTGPYAARLDSLHSIQVPADEPDRSDFLRTRRILILAPDYARDLHLRIFGAFASLGFDDHDWLADADLAWLVKAGESELQQVYATVQEQLALQAKQKAEGAPFSDKELKKAEASHAKLAVALEPYQAEHRKRGQS